MKAYIKNFLYVPAKHVDKKKLIEFFRRDHFDNKICNTINNGGTCIYKYKRPVINCNNCPGFYGRYDFFGIKQINGKNYMGIAKGRMDLIKNVIDINNYKIIDTRSSIEMTHGLKFNENTLYGYQKKAVKSMLKYEYGLLKSAPRTGKTVMMAAIAIALKQKTLIIAHQDSLLIQFYNTFHNKDIKFTNAPDLLETKDPIHIIKKISDIWNVDADIYLTNYQKFLQGTGASSLDKISDYFGTIIIDEIHRGNADAYSRILSKLYPKYIYGCSGTIKRKDGKHFIIDMLLGKVVHTTDASPMKPVVNFQFSKLNANITGVQWQTLIKRLCSNKVRNTDIVECIIKDIKDGHHIVVPVTFRWYIDELVVMINKKWQEYTGEDREVAAAFYAYRNPKEKEEVLRKAKTGEIKCTIAMRGMLLGINVPLWNMMYQIIPINNPPNFEQEINRITTPYENKLAPKIRFFIDKNFSVSISCFWSCYRTMKSLDCIITGEHNDNILRDLPRSGRNYKELTYRGVGRITI